MGDGCTDEQLMRLAIGDCGPGKIRTGFEDGVRMGMPGEAQGEL